MRKHEYEKERFETEGKHSEKRNQNRKIRKRHRIAGKNPLCDNHGSMLPLAIAVLLGMMLLATVVMEYLRLAIIASGVRDAYEEAIISVVNDNYNEVYHCVREGYAAGYEPTGEESFYESLDFGDVEGRLTDLLELRSDGDAYLKMNENGELEYQISNIRVEVKNAPMVRSGEKFYAVGDLVVTIPVDFAGRTLCDLPLRIKAQAKLTEVF